MPERLLKLDDLCTMNSADNISNIFKVLGYNTLQSAQPLAISDLELPARSAEAIWDAYMIADQRRGTDSLQVLLFQLQAAEWESPGLASSRMRSIATSLCKRPSNFLLLGTRDYNQLLLVNPRKSFDAQMNLKVGIRKLLIDRTNPTPYDRDSLEAIAAHNLDPQALYKAQCEAFDIEKLTQNFYRGYRDLFERVQQTLRAHNNHSYFDDTSRLHQFAQRLLGRTMFLYFLQKKGFLAGDRDFLKHQYHKLKPEPEDSEFYSSVLEPLFFDILNHQRPNSESPWGKIPYLNGGLFDRDYGEDVVDAGGWETPLEITLPNSLFDPSGEKGILKFFNSYNFTIAENIQDDEDVAVDPELLGKVFENSLAADERGQSGTFYTPRGIVQFMCVESLSRYLADETGIELETVRKLTEYDPEWLDSDVKKLLTKEQAKKLRKALESVKICDPAVGSGAFPMGMMQVMLAVRQAIARREGMTVQRGSLTMSEWKRDIIANNLYGVDIKPEAVEIAKLRLWLSMVVDIPSVDDVEPLPNLDYKLMCGNSLISTVHGERLIPDPTKAQQGVLNVTPVQAAIQPLLKLQHEYFSAQTDERKELREQIREAEKAVFRAAIADRRQHWEAQQRKLGEDIRLLKGKASRAQTQEQQKIETKLKELDQIEADVERGLRSVDFFQWHLHFNEVFAERGGFDIVIGNPPYVRQELQEKEFKALLKFEFPTLFKGRADIYTYFYGKGIDLTRQNGHLAFISSNKFMRAAYGDCLRNYISSNLKIHTIVDFGDQPVFDATTYPCILVIQKQIPTSDSCTTSMLASEEKDISEVATQVVSKGFSIPQNRLTSSEWTLQNSKVLALLDKLKSTGVTLNSYVDGKIFYGIKTGLNDAFIVNHSTYEDLISEDAKSKEILKPWLRGQDIKSNLVNWGNLYLIYAHHGIKIENYPAIYKYLRSYKDRLMQRATIHSHEWYELQQPQYVYSLEFHQPKIVYPHFAASPQFALDTQGYFVNDKAYTIPVSDSYLLALLNSKLTYWFLKQIIPPVRGGYLELRVNYMQRIPVAMPSQNTRQEIDLLYSNSANRDEIDRLIYKIYDLTLEEIAIIEGGQ